MTSEAPERIWADHAYVTGFSGVLTGGIDFEPSEVVRQTEYIRADLHQQALEAARVEGRRAGLEEAIAAVEVLKGQCVDPHVKVWAINRAEAIRAKIDKPADPVAEAARVLASAPVEDLIAATEAALHEMGTPRPKDSKQHHRAYFLAVCCALAQKEGE